MNKLIRYITLALACCGLPATAFAAPYLSVGTYNAGVGVPFTVDIFINDFEELQIVDFQFDLLFSDVGISADVDTAEVGEVVPTDGANGTLTPLELATGIMFFYTGPFFPLEFLTTEDPGRSGILASVDVTASQAGTWTLQLENIVFGDGLGQPVDPDLDLTGDGQVVAPLPSSIFLFGAGLLVMLGFKRHHRLGPLAAVPVRL